MSKPSLEPTFFAAPGAPHAPRHALLLICLLLHSHENEHPPSCIKHISHKAAGPSSARNPKLECLWQAATSTTPL